MVTSTFSLENFGYSAEELNAAQGRRGMHQNYGQKYPKQQTSYCSAASPPQHGNYTLPAHDAYRSKTEPRSHQTQAKLHALGKPDALSRVGSVVLGVLMVSCQERS